MKTILKVISGYLMFAAFVMAVQGFVLIILNVTAAISNFVYNGIRKKKIKATQKRIQKVETFRGSERVFH